MGNSKKKKKKKEIKMNEKEKESLFHFSSKDTPTMNPLLTVFERFFSSDFRMKTLHTMYKISVFSVEMLDTFVNLEPSF